MRNSRLVTSLLVAIALLVQAPVALAATGVTPWKTYLFSAMAIAMTIAVKNKRIEDIASIFWNCVANTSHGFYKVLR